MAFRFLGRLPASKSILNRLLVIQSFSAGGLQIDGESSCDDVKYMREALSLVMGRKDALAPVDCGAAGTTFRFLALRASRFPGRHLLRGSERLLARPQGALIGILEQLGVQAELNSRGLLIDSKGWQSPKNGALMIDRSQSSQFASAVMLSAWDLDFDLSIQLVSEGETPSEGYLVMSEALLCEAGMSFHREAGNSLTIKKGSQVRATMMKAEPDLSSCFAIAALAAINENSSACIEAFPRQSLQPDAVFPQVLRHLGVEVRHDVGRDELKINGVSRLRSLEMNLGDCPDLFPVLAVLCAFAEGRSNLFGAKHLIHKESDRIKCIAELVRALGREVELRADGLVIHGRGLHEVSRDPWEFDPQEDHRLAMAAAVAQVAGSGVRVLHPEVVNKSFPEFWQIFRGGRA